MSLMHWVVMALPVAAITLAFLKAVHAFEEMRERAQNAEEALEDILVAQASDYHQRNTNVPDHQGRHTATPSTSSREYSQVPVARLGSG